MHVCMHACMCVYDITIVFHVFSLSHLTDVTLTGTIHAQHVYLGIVIQVKIDSGVIYACTLFSRCIAVCKHLDGRHHNTPLPRFDCICLRTTWDIKKNNEHKSTTSTRMSCGFSHPSRTHMTQLKYRTTGLCGWCT